LLIANTFPPGGAPGRDNADDFILILLFDRVGNEENHNFTDPAYRSPPAFPIHDPILFDESAWIQEYLLRQFEANAVLPGILFRFSLIPFEQDHFALL
jgi:hypothetical protein